MVAPTRQRAQEKKETNDDELVTNCNQQQGQLTANGNANGVNFRAENNNATGVLITLADGTQLETGNCLPSFVQVENGLLNQHANCGHQQTLSDSSDQSENQLANEGQAAFRASKLRWLILGGICIFGFCNGLVRVSVGAQLDSSLITSLCFVS